MHCSKCKKIGLEEDFVFVRTDVVYGFEVPICYDCAPIEELKLKWGDEGDTPDEANSTAEDAN